MWKEMRKGKCKTKRKSGAFFLCTLHLQDGRGEKGSEGGRKTSDGKDNLKIWREKQKREKGRKEAKLEREGKGERSV